MEFDWDEHNIAHILEHHVTRQEVEEALRGRCVHLEITVRSGEERLSRLGRTSSGRILYLVITLRDGRIRPVPAFTARRAFSGLYTARYGEKR